MVSNKILTALVETNGVPGMGASVWRDGKVIWSGSAGYRDLEKGLPVTSDTIFRLASVSKLIAVAAAARLVQEGALDIDQPVAAILPDLSANWSPLTTRQLAAHIAGLPHYQAVDMDRGGSAMPRSAMPSAFSRIAICCRPQAANTVTRRGATRC